MTAEIVQAQINTQEMSGEEIKATLNDTFLILKGLQDAELSGQAPEHNILCLAYTQKTHPFSTGNSQKVVNNKGTYAPKRQSNFCESGPIQLYTFSRASRYYSAH